MIFVEHMTPVSRCFLCPFCGLVFRSKKKKIFFYLPLGLLISLLFATDLCRIFKYF